MLSFCALTGNLKAKEAISFLLINPSIKSLLIVGEKGGGKSSLLRNVLSLDEKAVFLPPTIKVNELRPDLHLKQTIERGVATYTEGFLERIHHIPLVADDIHLLERSALHLLIAGAGSIFASLCEEEAAEPERLKEQFCMIVRTEYFTDVETRVQLMTKALVFENKEPSIIREAAFELEAWKNRIRKSKGFLSRVFIPYPIKKHLADYLEENRVEGNHFEGHLLEIVRASAAYEGRETAIMEDLEKAIELVFSERHLLPVHSNSSDDSHEIQEPSEGKPSEKTSNVPPLSQESTSAPSEANPEEQIFAIKKAQMPSFEDFRRRVKKTIPGTGRKESFVTEEPFGVPIRTADSDEYEDIDLFATVIKAAPHQKIRGYQPGKALLIEKQDLQRKVRERTAGRHLLLLVDASASLGVNRRMESIKGAVFSLLQEAYVKRDRVGMLAFRDGRCEQILPMTRSLYLAKNRLEELPSGGNTPLALAMKRALEEVRAVRKRQPEALVKVYIISDGRANWSETEGSPRDEALYMARAFYHEKIDAFFIDYEQGRFRVELMRELARQSGGRYVHMDTFEENMMSRLIGEKS